MLNAVLSPPNAILFVFDPRNRNVVVPQYIDGELTASSNTCVSVGTQADVDGATEVSLSLCGVASTGLQEVFRGVIGVPSGKLAVVTSQFQPVLELEVPAGTVEITIWADELISPGRIAVNAKPNARS